jgi:hypothetical protein
MVIDKILYMSLFVNHENRALEPRDSEYLTEKSVPVK